jgi:hypothetical protein
MPELDPICLCTVNQQADLWCLISPADVAHLIACLLLRRIVLWEALLTFAFVSAPPTICLAVACCCCGRQYGVQ